MTEEINFNVVQDAYIDIESPNANFGGADTLKLMSASPYWWSLLSFTPNFSLNETQVFLSIWLSYSYPENCYNNITAYAMLENFDENTITYSSYPGDTPEGGTSAHIEEGTGWRTIDITEVYKYHKNKSHDFCTLVLGMAADDELLEFSSKEGSHTPFISIIYEAAEPMIIFTPIWKKQIGEL